MNTRLYIDELGLRLPFFRGRQRLYFDEHTDPNGNVISKANRQHEFDYTDHSSS